LREIQPADLPNRAETGKISHPAAAWKSAECGESPFRQDAANEEIKVIVTALGTGIGQGDYDVSN